MARSKKQAPKTDAGISVFDVAIAALSPALAYAFLEHHYAKGMVSPALHRRAERLKERLLKAIIDELDSEEEE